MSSLHVLKIPLSNSLLICLIQLICRAECTSSCSNINGIKHLNKKGWIWFRIAFRLQGLTPLSSTFLFSPFCFKGLNWMKGIHSHKPQDFNWIHCCFQHIPLFVHSFNKTSPALSTKYSISSQAALIVLLAEAMCCHCNQIPQPLSFKLNVGQILKLLQANFHHIYLVYNRECLMFIFTRYQ